MKISSSKELAFMPNMVDGETLYSWNCHYDRLSGNAIARTSSIQLFDNKFTGLCWDLPNRLERFVSMTKGLLGDVETLIYNRTLFGYFTPFQTEQTVLDAISIMTGDTFNTVKKELGIHSSLFGAYNHPKACPDCMKADMKKYSISKWYLEHQWPSAYVCRKHRKLLRILKLDSLPDQVSKFILPHEVTTDGWEDVPPVTLQTIRKLIKVVDFTANLALNRECNLDPEVLRYTYMLGAKNHGWLNTNETIRPDLPSRFNEHYIELKKIPGFERVKFFDCSQGFASSLFRQNSSRHHPTRHFLLMAFLFDTPFDFNQSYSQVKAAFQEGGMDGVRALLNFDWHEEIQRLIEVEKMSVKNAATVLNVNIWQIKYFIRKNGINYHRKSQCRRVTIIDDVFFQFKKLVLKGVSASEISKKLKIDRTTINYHINGRPELREFVIKKKQSTANVHLRSVH